MKGHSFHAILKSYLEETTTHDFSQSHLRHKNSTGTGKQRREESFVFSAKTFWFPQTGRGIYAQFSPPPTLPPPLQQCTRTLGTVETQALLIFQNLGAVDLSSSSTLEELKQAFRLLAKRWHPDKHLDLTLSEKQKISETFCQLKHSYDCLKKAFATTAFVDI